MTYDVGNSGPSLGQAQQYGGVKSVNGIRTLPLLKIGSPTAKQIFLYVTNKIITLLINALLYPNKVDSIIQTYKYGYIPVYIYKHKHTNQSYIKTNIIIIQLYWVHSPQC